MRIPLNWLEEFVTLPKDQKVLTDSLTMAGHMLDKVDTVNGKKVIDLELRGNRADCYSVFGIAREVSALFRTPVRLPKIHKELKKVKDLPDAKLTVATEHVKRVMLVSIKDVKIAPSPKWLANRLVEYGMPTINNIVDLSNFVMIETGQPNHTWDLDKVGKELTIRFAKKKEEMITFLDQKVILTNNDLVWANNKSVLAVAGAIGEKYHSINENTKNILVEAAIYDRANVRRSIHRLKLLTESGIRLEKELDPNLVEFGIYRFLQLIEENKWGIVEPYVFDYYPVPVKAWTVNLNYSHLETISGVKIEHKFIKNILEQLKFKITKDNVERLEVLVPTYRTDVRLEEDLVEEVLRIYGYDKIPNVTLSLQIPDDITPNYIKQEIEIKQNLVSLGFNEVISLPFVEPNLQNLNKYLGNNSVDPVQIENRPSPEVEFMRTSTLPNLHKFVTKIINERGNEAQLFEVGKIYYKKGTKYIENRKVGLISWQKENKDFSTHKGFLDALFQKSNINDISFTIFEIPWLKNAYSIKINGLTVGYGGKIGDVNFTELDLDALLGKKIPSKAKLWPNYPPQIEDITLEIKEGVYVGNVITVIREVSNIISDVEIIDIYHNSYTFRIWYQHPDKTLTDKEIEEVRSVVLKSVKREFEVKVK